MRHFSPFGGLKAAHLAGEHAQAFGAALFGTLEQRLQAHAHPEERPAGRDVLHQRRDEVAFAELVHRVRGGADAGEHDRAGPVDIGGVGAHERVRADVFEGARDATQVACVVVDNDDGAGGH